MPVLSLKEFFAADSSLRRSIYKLSLVYLILVVFIGLAGYSYYINSRKALIFERKNKLSIIAELKVNQISNWRYERLSDADEIMPIFASSSVLRRLSELSGKEERQKAFYELVRQFYDDPEYEGIYLYSKNLKEIAFKNKSGQSSELNKFAKEMALVSISERRPFLSDPYANSLNKSVYLDIYVPVIEDTAKGKAVIGLIILRIDPNKFLFPFIQSWPGVSKSGETLLVKKENDKVLFLNKLKFSDQPSLSFSLPANLGNLPAAMAVQGFEGVMEGMDYRKMPVVAAIKSVPQAQWKLIAKADRNEIYTPVETNGLLIGGVALGLVLTAGALIGLIWYGQIAAFYRKQYETEAEHKVIARRCEDLLRYANVIIIVFSDDMRVVEANDKATRAYQYTPVEILQLHLRDLQAPGTFDQLEAELKIAREKGDHIFNTVHKRKDGSTFHVEMIMQHFVIEWNYYFQAVIRELT